MVHIQKESSGYSPRKNIPPQRVSFNPPQHLEDFPERMRWACSNLQLKVIIEKIQSEADAIKSERTIRKGKLHEKSNEFPGLLTDLCNSESPVHVNENIKEVTHIFAKYSGDILTQIIFDKNKKVPMKIIHVLGTVLKQEFPEQVGLTIKSGLDMHILHELGKLIHSSNITELYLDNTFVPSANYDTLLDSTNNLTVLSLCRCKLGDIATDKIIKKLEPPNSAAFKLCVFYISSNHLTDKTANSLAEMLRVNRKLAYINLSGNMITADGAQAILAMLKDFPMTEEEIYDYKSEYKTYLKRRKQIKDDYMSEKKEYLRELILKEMGHKTLAKMKKLDVDTLIESQIRKKVEEYTTSICGKFAHCFHTPIKVNGRLYSAGNDSLTYLNLAYNKISFPFLPFLINVMKYQREIFFMNRKGLGYIQLDGNPLPRSCRELTEIENFITGGPMKKRKTTQTKKYK